MKRQKAFTPLESSIPLPRGFLTGFTLIELLISSSILAVILVTLYSAFSTGMFGYRNIEENINAYQSARQIMEQIDKDLRNCFAFSDEETKFNGNSTQMSFLAVTDSYNAKEITGVYSFISYELSDGKLMRLERNAKDCLNKNSQIAPEELPADIEEVIFSYGYLSGPDNALVFKDSWEQVNELPCAVKIKLTLKSKIKTGFERTVFLPLRNER